MTPIVLHHGFLGFDTVQLGPLKWSYFGGGVESALSARGHPVLVRRVSRLASIATRAQELKKLILDELERLARPNDRVVILAHSMGGLDARYMIHKLDMARHVSGVVTICTPHRGSSYADWALKNIDWNKMVPAAMGFLGLDLAGARDLTLAAMARFNDEVPDHPDVAYYSVSACRPWHRVPAFFLHSHRVVSQAEGDNDGLVSVTSAQWGTHLDCWPADHLHAVNRRMVLEIRKPTGDMIPRYMKILDRLADDGIIGVTKNVCEGVTGDVTGPQKLSSAGRVRL